MFELDESLAYRTYRLSRLLRRHFLHIGDEAGIPLTQEQFFLLDKLHRQDGQSQTDLADDALQDRANLTRMVADLEKRGLIARRPDPDDGRRKRVHLTLEGARVYSAFVEQVVVPARQVLFRDLDPDDVAAVHRVFDLLQHRLS